MLYWMCEKSGVSPTWSQLEHAICRNFGGMELDELDTLEEFKRQIHILHLQSIPQKVHLTTKTHKTSFTTINYYSQHVL